LRTVGVTVRRFALITVACAVVLAAAKTATGYGTQVSIASAVFIGATVLIAVNALGESSSRDRGFASAPA